MLLLGIAGNVSVAAYGVVANLSLVAMSIFNGLAQGAQPLISKSYGEGQRDHVKACFAGVWFPVQCWKR